MRIVGLGMMLTALTLPSAVSAQNDAELACVYQRAVAEDALILYAMGQRTEPQDPREGQAMDRFADQVSWCRERHGWTDLKAVAAVQYALGRSAYEDASSRLGARGFEPDFLELVISDLGGEGIAMLRSGDDRPENLAFVGSMLAQRLQDSRASIADREDLMNVGRIVARGVAAASVRDRGAAAFATR